MNDETVIEETPAAAAEAVPQAETSPLAQPLAAFIVTCTRLEHDGVTYLAGETFRCTDERVIAELRRAEAIALPEQLMAAEDLAAQAAAKDAEIEALRAEIEALRRAAETTTKRGK